MMRKILILIFLIILFSNFVIAINVNDNLKNYYSFDTNLNDDKLNLTSSASGAFQSNTQFKLGNNSLSCDGNNDYLDLGGIILPSTGDFYMSFWGWQTAVQTSTTQSDIVMSQYDLGQVGRFLLSTRNSGAVLFADSGELTPKQFTTTADWNKYGLARDGNNWYFYKNGNNVLNYTNAGYSVYTGENTFICGVDDFAQSWYGYIDEFAFYHGMDYSESQFDELDNTLYNNGTGLNPLTYVQNFTINSNLNNFSVNISNSTINYYFNTTNGEIVTNLSINDSKLYNITGQSPGYFSVLNQNYNISSSGDLYINFSEMKGFDIEYLNYVSYNNTNYTRNLSIKIIVDSCPSDNIANMYIDGVLNQTYTINCTSNTDLSVYYVHDIEGKYSINWTGSTQTDLDNITFEIDTQNFTSDLNSPSIDNLNLTISEGFLNGTANVTYSCSDNITPLLFYNTSFNNQVIYAQNITNGTLILNSSLGTIDGQNNLSFVCSDFFSNISSSVTQTSVKKVLHLIDEVDNTDFDPTNISSARVYFDDNTSFYDFKANAKSRINYTTNNVTKLRFELIYSDGSVITRWIDVSIVSESNLRVCANKDDVIHYEQLILSSTSSKVAILESVFSTCYVAADYTRFAYQDALVLKAFTIPVLYSIYTNDNTLLASLDGSISSFINLDTLEFTQSAVDINLLGDGLSFEKTTSNTIKIYYKNIEDDNTALDLKITRLDTNQIVFTKSTFSDPNEFTLYFDYTTLNNVTNQTIFQLFLTKTTNRDQRQVKRYFDTNANVGIIKSIVGLVLSAALLLIGLTVAISRTTFSWLGIIVTVASIAILGVTITAWYVIFFMCVEVILLIYIILNLVYLTYPEVT